MSDRPDLPDHAPLLPADRRRSPPTTDRCQRLHRGSTAHHPDHHHQTERLGLPLAQGGQVPSPKKVPETDAIFDQLKEVHAHAAQSEYVLRVSLDAKATIPIGPFSRGGRSRTGTQASDHDFKPAGTLTPFGLFLPEHDELNLYFTSSKVTSDFIVTPWKSGGWSRGHASRRRRCCS